MQDGFLSMTTLYTFVKDVSHLQEPHNLEWRLRLTLPVDPRTLNSSFSAFPSLSLSIMKNLTGGEGTSALFLVLKRVAVAHRWRATRSARSKMAFGHAFLKIAPRFSGAGALGSFALRAFLAAGWLLDELMP